MVFRDQDLVTMGIRLVIASKAFAWTELRYMLFKQEEINHMFSLIFKYKITVS